MDRVALEAALQSTTCSDMRDRELLQWLRAAEEWFPLYGAQIDVCLHLVRILCTFPWGRFTSASHSTGSTGTVQSSHKTIAKLLGSFERLCCALISRSQQLMVPALEAALKPFSVLGVRNAVPIDSITRIINHCVATYPGPSTIQQLLNQALEPLCPPKRWGSSFHHECYMVTLLNLALEAQLPHASTLVGSFKELSVLSTGGDLLTSSVGLPHTPMSTPALAPHQHGNGRPQGSTVLSTGEVSDALLMGKEGVQLSGHNKLMSQQVRLIGLVLTKLLEMEMSIEFEDRAIETIVDERRRRKKSRKEHSRRSSHSVQNTPALTSSGGGYSNNILNTPQTAPLNPAPSTPSATSASALAEQFAYEQQDPNGDESPIHMLKMAVARVHERLAAEMSQRRLIGACDRPAWWSELQAFHVDCVSKIKNPVALHFLAPSIAVMGVAGEATELMHKVVSAVLKGGCEKRPSVNLAAAAMMRGGGGGGGGGMGRMVPPAQSEKLNPKQRALAATHIFPLFVSLHKHLQSDTCEGLVRRLFKFVATEGSAGGGGGVGGAIGMGSLGMGGGGMGASSDVVDAVLGQVLCMCRMLEREAVEDIPDVVKGRIMSQLEESTNANRGDAGGDHHHRHRQQQRLSGHKRGHAHAADADADGADVEDGDGAAVDAIDSATMSKVCDYYIRQHRVKPELYSSRCPWSSNRYNQLWREESSNVVAAAVGRK